MELADMRQFGAVTSGKVFLHHSMRSFYGKDRFTKRAVKPLPLGMGI